jgi:lysophospholipase L1-like esterase
MPPAPGLSGNTLRQIVRTTLRGKQLRMRFSNIFGDGSLTMQAVRLAASAGGGAINTGAAKTVLFKGNGAVTIAKGESVVSDPFDYDLAPMSDIAISIFFGDVPAALTGHPGSRSTSYLQIGNAIDETTLPQSAKATRWYVITGIDVMADAPSAEVIALGDSITDGRGSTTDGNDRWTDNLARRLHANQQTAQVTVLNQGLGGNAILAGGLGPTALTRFDRDVLGQSAPRWLIIFEGVNDIGASKSPTLAADLIAAYQQFIEKAHAHNIRVYGVPILPFGRSMYFSAAHEAARQSVNEWIRTSGKFDAVIDMDAAVRDPAEPANLLAAYDTGDHLHPNVAGYQKMAEAADLDLFRP